VNERVESLLAQLVAEAGQTNRLLEQILTEQRMLIAALAEESDPDTEPTHYLDGTPRCL
jgi:hypothetical protein